MADSLIVNETRIRDEDGFCGTVAYVGPVASAKKKEEIYAGIIWDDPSRGKHDGSVICRQTNNIVRHFSCGPTQGSFLRQRKIDRGISLTSSLLKSKYVEMQAPAIAPNNLLPHSARTSSGRDKPIEFLGEMKIRGKQQLTDIDKISLRREGISSASDEEFANEFERIEHIDLAGNLLCNWEQVLKIMSQFPQLSDFSVAYNRVRDINLPLQGFDKMKVLNLNNCSIRTFQTLQWIGKSMPNLESLCIASADLSDIENLELCGLEELKILDCSSCCLTSWSNQVMKLGLLPSLEQLSINDNAISNIPKWDDKEKPLFPRLLSLQIAGTKIQNWVDLEGINSLPELKSLRFKNTPLTSTMGQGEVRFLSIARFPNLEYFNASSVSSKERIEAERRYVSFVANLISAHGSETMSTENNLEADHPQYALLREKHKSLIISANNQSGKAGSSLASTVCNVTITSMAANSCSMEPLVRRLPGSLTVGRLKALCGRAFGLDIDLMTLHFRTEGDAFPVELDNDDNTLNYYGVCDGASILMNEIDVEAQRRETKRKEDEQDKRIEEHERHIASIEEQKRRS